MNRYLTLFCALACSIGLSARGKVYLNSFMEKDSGAMEDASLAIRRALEECVRTGAESLVLPGGTLKIRPERAFERFEYISNNDPSIKRIAFLMKGLKGFTIEGNGTLLMFSGYISPFSMEDCSDIVIRDLSIDYQRPFVSEGLITGAGPGWFDVRFEDSYGAEISDGTLRFRDEEGRVYPFGSLLEFDRERREVAFHARDYWIWSRAFPALRTGSGDFRLQRKDFGEAKVGNIMVFGASARLHPGFTLLGCKGIRLERVNIYHCGGMGVIAQSCSDMELDNVVVEPAPGSGRVISVSADATHFVNCKGYIRMTDCVFRNQKDDATNIHGWYMAVDSISGADRLTLRWRNSGQYGVRFLKEGMRLEFVDNKTMMTYACRSIGKVDYLNSEFAEVWLTENLPEGIKTGHVVAEDEGYPEVLIKGCYIGNNRARGLLLGSRGKTVVENCVFHTPGAAILFEGDGNFWYEQSGVRDVTIRNNVFENCMYGSKTWGDACIAVGSGIPDRESSCYHRNIVVENNSFRFFDNRIVNIYCVDGFVFRGNLLEESGEYPSCGEVSGRFIHSHCDNVEILP